MIALQDQFKQDELKKNTRNKHKTNNTSPRLKTHEPRNTALALRKAACALLYSVTSKLSYAYAMRKEHKQDKLALERLLQLDDALLKDMGIERRDLEAVRSGALTLDALNKYGIVAARDNSSNTHFIRK